MLLAENIHSKRFDPIEHKIYKDYNLPEGNPWTNTIKENCKKEAKLKMGVLKDILKLIHKMWNNQNNSEDYDKALEELKQKIQGK